MKKNDARKLDYKTLEAIRERAVRRVQDGESPEVIPEVLGINRSTIPAWRLERLEGQASSGPATET